MSLTVLVQYKKKKEIVSNIRIQLRRSEILHFLHTQRLYSHDNVFPFPLCLEAFPEFFREKEIDLRIAFYRAYTFEVHFRALPDNC